MNEDLEFLTSLDKKLHYKQRCHGSGAFSHHWSLIDCYTEEKMTKEEIDKVLEISKGMNYIIYPMNTSMGFSVGYDVCQINPIGKKEVLLRFEECQLPNEYNFNRMSKAFMDKANLAKAKIIEEKIVNDYSHYDY